MARLRWCISAPALLLCFAILLLDIQTVTSASASAKPASVKSDVKYIRCAVCEHIVKQAIRTTNRLREEKGSKLTEYDIIEQLEHMCKHDREQGEWITKIDLVEDGKKLKLVEMPTMGECGTECATVARACDDVLAESDTDLAERLFAKHEQRAALTQWLCHDVSGACRKKPPPLPASRPKGPPFTPVDPQKREMDKLMASMGDMGMKGQIFDREEALRRVRELGDDGDDEDDEDDARVHHNRDLAGDGLGPTLLRAARQSYGALWRSAAALWQWAYRHVAPFGGGGAAEL